MEEKKKGSLGIIICLVILVLGLAGYICYDNFFKGSTKEQAEAHTAKDGYITFYNKDGKKLSEFKCDGYCAVNEMESLEDGEPFNYQYVDKSGEAASDKIKINTNGSSKIILLTCDKEDCAGIDYYGGLYFLAKEGKNNVGSVILFDMETGKQVKYDNIESLMNMHTYSILVSKTDEVISVDEDYPIYAESDALLFNDGTYLDLKEVISQTCYEGCYPDGVYGNNIVTINSNLKFGLRDMKTGKVTLEYKFDDIIPASGFWQVGLDGLAAKENGKYNLYNGSDLSQITKNGYDYITIVEKDLLLVSNDNNYYFIDLDENIVSDKVNVIIKGPMKHIFNKYYHSLGSLPHEHFITVEKMADDNYYVKFIPDLYGDFETREELYYIYKSKTKEFTKTTKEELCSTYKQNICD